MDETSLLAANAHHPTLLVTGFVDLDRHRLIDVVPGRSAEAVSAWLRDKPARWLVGIATGAASSILSTGSDARCWPPTSGWTSPAGIASSACSMSAIPKAGSVPPTWPRSCCVVYDTTNVDEARRRLRRFYDYCRSSDVTELQRLVRTIRRWGPQILAWHVTGLTNGSTEGVNLLVKKIKRVGHGFRNFENYRLRLLLRCGVSWKTHRAASIRARHPRSIA